MKRFALALTAFLASALPVLAVPVLKGDITVNAAIVTVGDMFDNAGELAETAIFRAPAPGTTGIVPLSDVAAAARLVGVTSFENVGYTRVRVMRTAADVDAALLAGIVGDTLNTRGITSAALRGKVQFDRADIDIKAEAVATPVTLLDFSYSPDSARFIARFDVAGIDQPIDLTGSVQFVTSVPRLVQNVAAGTVLTPADFELIDMPLGTASAGRWADLDQLVGKQLVRPGRAGLMLKATDVAAPQVVARNALVTVLFKAGPMTLTVKAQALTAAAAGEPVQVMNSITHKILHGIAQPDGTVTVDAGAADTTKTASL